MNLKIDNNLCKSTNIPKSIYIRLRGGSSTPYDNIWFTFQHPYLTVLVRPSRWKFSATGKLCHLWHRRGLEIPQLDGVSPISVSINRCRWSCNWSRMSVVYIMFGYAGENIYKFWAFLENSFLSVRSWLGLIIIYDHHGLLYTAVHAFI